MWWTSFKLYVYHYGSGVNKSNAKLSQDIYVKLFTTKSRHQTLQKYWSFIRNQTK